MALFDGPISYEKVKNQCFGTALENAQKASWYGAFLLREEGIFREFKVGQENDFSNRVLAWQHPRAAPFFHKCLGEFFVWERGGEDIESRLMKRLKLKVDSDHEVPFTVVLEEYREDGNAAVTVVLEHAQPLQPQCEERVPDGPAETTSQMPPHKAEEPLARPAKGAASFDLPSEITAFLTPAQFSLIASSMGKPLIIQGKAGSGKTTVALHRLSWLTFRQESKDDQEAFSRGVRQEHSLVMMFNKSLEVYIQSSLASLGLSQVIVRSFETWVEEHVREATSEFIDVIPARMAEHHGTATRLKAQMGILYLLEDYVARQRVQNITWQKQHCYKNDLLRIFSDTERVTSFLGCSIEEAEALCAHQQAVQQFGAQNTEVGPRITRDDLPLMLWLVHLKNGGIINRQGEIYRYDHIMIDEAQDFGGVGLRVLLASVSSKNGLTIVGDVNQKIIPSVDFPGWEAIAAELGLEGAQVEQLTVGHRSTREIMQLADSVVEEQTSPDGRHGPKPQYRLCQHHKDVFEFFRHRIEAQFAICAEQHIAVLFPDSTTLNRLAPFFNRWAQKQDFPVRVCHNRVFEFSSGVTLAMWNQVKGLEFDRVFVMDSPEVFQPSLQGRRNLYMVITRAQKELVFAAFEQISPVLKKAAEKGYLVEEKEK